MMCSPRILKYRLGVETFLPHNARILHIGTQNGKATVWAEADPAAGIDHGRKLVAVGTGDHPPRGLYRGTAIGVEGEFVLHFYETVG